MGFLLHHLSHGVFAPQKDGFGVDTHRQVPEILISQMQEGRLSTSQAYTGIVDHTASLATIAYGTLGLIHVQPAESAHGTLYKSLDLRRVANIRLLEYRLTSGLTNCLMG